MRALPLTGSLRAIDRAAHGSMSPCTHPLCGPDSLRASPAGRCPCSWPQRTTRSSTDTNSWRFWLAELAFSLTWI